MFWHNLLSVRTEFSGCIFHHKKKLTTNTTSKMDFQHVFEAIETTSSTNNDWNEDLIVPVELVDEDERFQDGYRDKEWQSDTSTTTTTKAKAGLCSS